MPSRVVLYADWLRDARPSQVVGRLRRLVPVALLAFGRSPTDDGWRAVAGGLGVDPAPQSGPQTPADITRTFTAIGREKAADDPALWKDSGEGLLFQFHVHGFSELARFAAGPAPDPGRRFWENVVDRWLRECGTPSAPGWHPFPLSGRLVAWSAALSVPGWLDAAPGGLAERMRASLRGQLRLLRRSVEYDVGGNHVIRNAAALVVAGGCLLDERALAQGNRVLAREVARQVLTDGGHEERSPSYHREVHADLTGAAAVLERLGRPTAEWTARLAEMERWLIALTGPDGTLPLFNDAWDAPPSGPGGPEGVTDLAATGYVVARSGGECVIFDAGELAPSHLAAHAHADALAFALWSDGVPLVADPGAFTYAGPERDAFRATAAHATLTVDGRDQCVFWGAFRAAHLPRITARSVDCHAGGWAVVTAEHDGYRRLRDRVLHRRILAWHPQAGVVVVDRLEGTAAHSVVSRLPLHPEAPLLTDPVRVGALEVATLDGGPFSLQWSHYSRYLGQMEPCRVLVVERRLRPGERTGWTLLRRGWNASLDGDVLCVDGPAALRARLS